MGAGLFLFFFGRRVYRLCIQSAVKNRYTLCGISAFHGNDALHSFVDGLLVHGDELVVTLG